MPAFLIPIFSLFGFEPMFLSGAGAGGYTITQLLTSGTELVTWLVTTMGSFLTFLTSNTALLVWFFASLALLGMKIIRTFF